MMKFNDLGIEVLQLKEALLSDYPDIVKRSLLMSVQRMKDLKIISDEIIAQLEREDVLYDEFKSFCLSDEALLKSKELLIQTYEEKRIALSRYLNDVLETHKIHSYSYLEQDSIVFVKTFYFGHEEATDYFGFEKSDCKKMFEPYGFIYQFTALRLRKVLQDFIAQFSPTDLFILNATPVFYVKKAESFAIDFVLEIKIETFEAYTNEELGTPMIEIIESLGGFVAGQIPYHERFNETEQQKARYGFKFFKREKENKPEQPKTQEITEKQVSCLERKTEESEIKSIEPAPIYQETEEELKEIELPNDEPSELENEDESFNLDNLDDLDNLDISIGLDVEGIDDLEFDLGGL